MANGIGKKALTKGFREKTGVESIHRPRQGDILPAGYIYSAAKVVFVDGAPVKITIDRLNVSAEMGGLQVKAKVYNRVPQEDGSITNIAKLYEEVKLLDIPCAYTHIHFLQPQAPKFQMK